MFSFKLLGEKSIISKDLEITLLLLDMSKAFDMAKRTDLFENLKEDLDEDELHIIKIFVEPNIGALQEDRLKPILFITYQAETLKPVCRRTFAFTQMPKQIM